MNCPAPDDQAQLPVVAKAWHKPVLTVMFIADGTENTVLCGTVDSPCTKMSGGGFAEDCGTC